MTKRLTIKSDIINQKTKKATNKLNIGELLNNKPDTVYNNTNKNKQLKLLKVYNDYLIKYGNATYYCNIIDDDSAPLPPIKLESEDEYEIIKNMIYQV